MSLVLREVHLYVLFSFGGSPGGGGKGGGGKKGRSVGPRVVTVRSSTAGVSHRA